jgi:chromosome segregation ATPase
VTLASKEEELACTIKTINTMRVRHDEKVVVKKTAQVLEHKRNVENIRACHADFIEATMRLIEAKSDVEGLRERNQDIEKRLEQESDIVAEAVEKAAEARSRAKRAMKTVKEIQAEASLDGTEEFFRSDLVAPEGVTVEEREGEIELEEAKLQFMHADNPNAIRDFERRKADLERLQGKISAAETKLAELSHNITEIRGKWEPQLDELIGEISEAFAYNFEQIGCAGEVGIHKDEDFEEWSVEIKVKFRYSFPPPLLGALLIWQL